MSARNVLFDDGFLDHCDKPVAYLRKIGVNHIDCHVANHYHSDHIGCATEVPEMAMHGGTARCVQCRDSQQVPTGVKLTCNHRP